MALQHAIAGQVIDVRPLGTAFANAQTHTLLKTETLEVIRIVLAAGKRIAPHRVPGEITVQCLEGGVDFRARDTTRELTAGTLLYLEGGDEHSLQARENSTLLVTIVLSHKGVQ